jgi:hypothetical protein
MLVNRCQTVLGTYGMKILQSNYKHHFEKSDISIAIKNPAKKSLHMEYSIAIS